MTKEKFSIRTFNTHLVRSLSNGLVLGEVFFSFYFPNDSGHQIRTAHLTWRWGRVLFNVDWAGYTGRKHFNMIR